MKLLEFTKKSSDINISQGSVVTHFRCDGIFNDRFIVNFPKIVKMKKMKIGQYLMKLYLKYYWSLFSGHGVLLIAVAVVAINLYWGGPRSGGADIETPNSPKEKNWDGCSSPQPNRGSEGASEERCKFPCGVRCGDPTENGFDALSAWKSTPDGNKFGVIWVFVIRKIKCF